MGTCHSAPNKPVHQRKATPFAGDLEIDGYLHDAPKHHRMSQSHRSASKSNPSKSHPSKSTTHSHHSQPRMVAIASVTASRSSSTHTSCTVSPVLTARSCSPISPVLSTRSGTSIPGLTVGTPILTITKSPISPTLQSRSVAFNNESLPTSPELNTRHSTFLSLPPTTSISSSHSHASTISVRDRYASVG